MDSSQQPDKRGLSGAVPTDERPRIADWDRDADVVQHFDVRKALVNPTRLSRERRYPGWLGRLHRRRGSSDSDERKDDGIFDCRALTVHEPGGRPLACPQINQATGAIWTR